MSATQRVLGRRAATPTGVVVFSRDELDLIVELAGPCSLNESPGKNWVERSGGLPNYICRIAKAVRRTGKTTSQAIAIAVSRVKKWSTGAGVDADTQAKAVAALSQWEALKVKNKTRQAAKKVAATRTDTEVLCLAATSFNVDTVRRAFETRQREARRAWRAANPNGHYDEGPPNLWIKEQWTDYLIVSGEYGSDASLYKVPYTVDEADEVSFGEPVEVKTTYVVVESGDMVGDDLTDEALQKLLDLTVDESMSALDKVLALTADPAPTGPVFGPRSDSLARVLALAATGEYANTKATHYADPGYQKDKKKRYALDSKAQCQAAWSYISQADNAAKYSSADLAKVKAAIKAAGRRYGITFTDD